MNENSTGLTRRECSGALFLALAASGAPAWALSEGDAALGVRSALERGASSAVSLLGKTDGFMANPLVRIGLPPAMQDVAKLMKALGQQKRVDELVMAMNRAAEAAVPEGKAVLVGAVKSLSVDDALAIVKGGETSVTDYFSGKTRSPLGEKFLPIVTRATEKVKLAERYNSLAAKAVGLKLMDAKQANLQQYVTTKALDGLFLMIGEEEKKLRANPAQAATALLRRVFGN